MQFPATTLSGWRRQSLGIAGAALASALCLWLSAPVAQALAGMAFVGASGVCLWRAVSAEGAPRRPWGLWSVGALLWACGSLAMATGNLGIFVGLTSAGLVSTTLSITVVARMRDPQNDRSATVDGLLVAVAVALPLGQSGYLDPESVVGGAGAVVLGACVLVFAAALVRFWLAGGSWSAATMTFQVGSIATVAASLCWIAAFGELASRYGVALAAGGAILWISGGLDRANSRTFEAKSVHHGPLTGRGGVLTVVVLAPTIVLTQAFVDGRSLSTSTTVALSVLALLLVARIFVVSGTRSPSPTALVWAAGALVLWGGTATFVEVNAGAQRLSDQHDALMSYQRGLWDRMRPISGYAVGTIPAQRLTSVYVENTRRVDALPLTERDRRTVAQVTGAWITSIASINAQLQQRPEGRSARADRELQRAGAATAQVITALRSITERYATASDRSAERAQRLISFVAVLIALALVLLVRAYTRLQQRSSGAAARVDAMRDAQRRTAQLLDASADLVLIVDEDLQVHDAYGERISSIFGEQTPAGRNLAQYLDASAVGLYRQQVAALLSSHDSRGDATWKMLSHLGERHEVDVRIVDARRVPGIEAIVLSFKDLDKRSQIVAAVQSSQGRDPVTGLGDRGAAHRHLEQLLTRPQALPVALIKLDLDDFRAVNEQLGTAAGDQVLREVAQRLATTAGPGAHLARVGGNTFACIIDQFAPHQAERVGRTLLAAIKAPLELDGYRPILVRASAGITVCTSETSAPAAFRDAELAMYQAKAEQGNTLRVFTEDLRSASHPRVALRSELLTALAEQQFRLVYQPIVRPTTRDVVGYEALVRWDHPTHGIVSPAEFIPIAERTGLIVELGEWVLRTATQQLAEWLPYWPDNRYVTVNVASQQLEQPAFADLVAEAVKAAGIKPSQLVLEITESSLITDQTTGAERLQAIQALGVRVAIDDFGTGYSSLNYLHRFAVDIVKLDKSFIDDLVTDPRTHTLVTAISGMADGLDLTLVAEGVEHQEQVDALGLIGNALIQGYHYSPPLASDRILDFQLLSTEPYDRDQPRNT